MYANRNDFSSRQGGEQRPRQNGGEQRQGGGNQLALVQTEILACRPDFELRLIDKAMRFESEAGFAMQQLSRSSYSLGVALGNKPALAAAITNVAAIGLSLNPAKKHAYLVPRKDGGGPAQICLDISYMGLIELAVASGAIAWAQAKVVHQHDSYESMGPGAMPVHKYVAFSRERGQIVGVYVVAKLPSGDVLCEEMSVDDVNAIRDRSEAWKSGKSCPWKTDWAEMAKKTVVKRASKYWPKNDRVAQATHYLNTDGGEGLAELASNDTGGAQQGGGFDVDAWIARAQAAKTEKALTEVYGLAMQEAGKTRDRAGAERFKTAALAHRDALRHNTIDMPEAA